MKKEKSPKPLSRFELSKLHDDLAKDRETALLEKLTAMGSEEERSAELMRMATIAVRRGMGRSTRASDCKASCICGYAITAIVESFRTDGNSRYVDEARAATKFCLELANQCMHEYLPLTRRKVVGYVANAWGSTDSEELSREIMCGLVHLATHFKAEPVAECLRDANVDIARSIRHKTLIEETVKKTGSIWAEQIMTSLQTAVDLAALKSLPREVRERVMSFAPALGYMSDESCGLLSKSKATSPLSLKEVLKEIKEKAIVIAREDRLGDYFVSTVLEWDDGEPCVHVLLNRCGWQNPIPREKAEIWAGKTRRRAIPATVKARISFFEGRHFVKTAL
jgi:hypothetical protein